MKEHSWNKKTHKRFLSIFLVIFTGMIPATAGHPAVAAAMSSPPYDSSSTRAVSASSPAIAPSCDEAYYAILDYYGKLMDSSVVKSYLTNGNTKITDYGSYDEVINLTDDRQPKVSEDAVTFDLSGDTPRRFYFEGKTEQPFHDLPWTLSLSYRLNGVPTAADQLAGKSGLVEIHLDVIPNPSASEYNRNNLVLAATAVFNADDILSLEADGAQVQLIGNLRTVLFLALPGEEQHFVIRVGTNDFSFDGMIFLAVPATLSQLDQITDLRNARDKAENSYHAINDSLDVILNTLDGMSDSLNNVANGLDQLDSARKTISDGKSNLYSKADQVLDSLSAVSDALTPVSSHLKTASHALNDATDFLTALTRNAAALRPELETTRTIIGKLQDDMANIRQLTGSVESYSKSASDMAAVLKNDLDDLDDDMDDLRSSLSKLKNVLNNIRGISTMDTISVGGMTTAEEVLNAVSQAQDAYNQYNSMGFTEDQLPFKSFLIQYVGKSEAEADSIIALLNAAKDPKFEQQLKLMETANRIIPTINQTIREVNNLISTITAPTADVISDLQSLCSSLGDSGISGDLESMSRLASGLLSDLSDHKGELAVLTNHLDDIGNLAIRVSQNAGNALDLIQSLDNRINSYVPATQEALSSARSLSDTLAENLRDIDAFLGSAEFLMRTGDENLDTGSGQVLSGLADVLRSSSEGLAETDTIRSAKDTITSLMNDEWDKYTGGENNLLLMDAQAKPVSLTSSKNNTPTSVQYIMRSQEIKADRSKNSETSAEEETDSGTFWTRVKAMFVDFWNAITDIFHRS